DILRSGHSFTDAPGVVARHIAMEIAPGDTIYVVDYEPVIYHLTRTKLPTKYPFSPMLTNPWFANIGDVDVFGELAHIMAQQPKLVVLRSNWRKPPPVYERYENLPNPDFYARLVEYLDERYTSEGVIRDAEIFRFNDSAIADTTP